MSIYDPLSKEKILGEALECCDLKFLTPRQVFMLDEALAALGEWGEVRLVVNKGSLRFVVMERSYDVYKWRPGDGFSGNGHGE
jgi:hypothetical protein